MGLVKSFEVTCKDNKVIVTAKIEAGWLKKDDVVEDETGFVVPAELVYSVTPNWQPTYKLVQTLYEETRSGEGTIALVKSEITIELSTIASKALERLVITLAAAIT